MKWLRIALPIVFFPLGPLVFLALFLLAFELSGEVELSVVLVALGVAAPAAFRAAGLIPFGSRIVLFTPLTALLSVVLEAVAWAMTLLAVLGRSGVGFMGSSSLDVGDLVWVNLFWVFASAMSGASVAVLELLLIQDRRAVPHVLLAHVAWIVLGLAGIGWIFGQDAAGSDADWVPYLCGTIAGVATFGTPVVSAVATAVLERGAPEADGPPELA